MFSISLTFSLSFSLSLSLSLSHVSVEDCCQPVSDYPILVLGNKCDLVNQRMVSRESGEELAASIGARFFEVSAATGKNMEEVNVMFCT